ncbi:MAG: protein translocase subunit SecF [Alphaproteobacteria bacterium]|nr:protein translocase subunit SecF [Alphaproteobacteria bacterium]
MWWDKHDPNAPLKPDPKPLPFMKARMVGFVVTALVFIATTISLSVQGLNLGLDFTGGVLIEASSETVLEVADVRDRLETAGLGETSVNTTDGGRTALIRLSVEKTGADVEGVARQVTTALGAGVEIRKVDAVGPRVSGELFRDGVIASLLAIIAIALYIWFRFESKFGWAALVTTFHDVYAVIGLFSITRMTFDLTIVAGVLTVAGYSINDTVVVFDRIREMLKKYKKLPISDIIDISITATLSRTLMTSIATMLAAGTMLFLGGSVLFGFAASIVFGIIIGTYSSIFVAAPLLLYLPGRVPGQKAPSAEEEAQATS